MEWMIELQRNGRLIRVTTKGPFQLRQQQRMFEELGAHPASSQGPAILFDNRQIDMSKSDVDIMRQSVEIVQAFIRKFHVQRLAGLVDEGVNFGVGRQFETLTDVAGGYGFRLFKDEQLALRWLCGEQI